LLFLAAHDEHPDVPIPEEFPDEPHEHPLLQRVSPDKRRFFRRSASVPPRYYALYSPDLWLPTELGAVWSAEFVTGEEMMMSSTLVLRAQLRELARRLGAGERDLARWRESGGGGQVVGTMEVSGQIIEKVKPGSPQEKGRFGLALLLELAERAVEHTLPLKLDY
jgi:hypothetical protein